MKIARKEILLVNLLLCLLIILIACKEQVKTEVHQVSWDIEHSKELGVFVDSFRYSIDNLSSPRVNYEIIEAWSEKSWYYTDQQRNIRIGNHISFYIAIKDSDKTRLDYILDMLSIEDGIGTGYMHGKLTCNFRNNEIPDTIRARFFGDQEVVFLKEN